MARSSYIYIVFTYETDHLVAAFTVKHEMEKFRKSHPIETYYRRYRDGEAPEETPMMLW